MERGRVAGAVVSAAMLAAIVVSWPRGEPPADFVFVNGAEPKSLDPHLVTGQPEGRLVSALFERLVDWDPLSLEVRPGLAERWEVEDDATRFVFHLRDAVWSDGVPITAKTVRDSWRRLLDPATAAEYSYQLFPVKGAQAFATGRISDFDDVGILAEDDRTLVVELERPTPYFLHVCGFYPLAPVPLHAIARHGSPGWTKPGLLVSSGPFTLGLRRLRDRVRLVRNDRHHDAASVRLLDRLPRGGVIHDGTGPLRDRRGRLDSVAPTLRREGARRPWRTGHGRLSRVDDRLLSAQHHEAPPR